jgi:hypothetical protein
MACCLFGCGWVVVGLVGLVGGLTCLHCLLVSHSLFVLDLSHCFSFAVFGDPVHIGLTNTSHIFLRGWLLVLFVGGLLRGCSCCSLARFVSTGFYAFSEVHGNDRVGCPVGQNDDYIYDPYGDKESRSSRAIVTAPVHYTHSQWDRPKETTVLAITQAGK